ncbi:hypothetical protein [Rhizobium sp. Leaf262]|uniref:hypothetical protein n=1 Tax=Rhizobium sp. Leaf262 TaxID=1736312 RepID=UPI0012E79035|nr:hypothetical protein [Rhizobium sp. Leaf262]
MPLHVFQHQSKKSGSRREDAIDRNGSSVHTAISRSKLPRPECAPTVLLAKSGWGFDDIDRHPGTDNARITPGANLHPVMKKGDFLKPDDFRRGTGKRPAETEIELKSSLHHLIPCGELKQAL